MQYNKQKKKKQKTENRKQKTKNKKKQKKKMKKEPLWILKKKSLPPPMHTGLEGRMTNGRRSASGVSHPRASAT
jgi:hypothetical protein